MSASVASSLSLSLCEVESEIFSRLSCRGKECAPGNKVVRRTTGRPSRTYTFYLVLSPIPRSQFSAFSRERGKKEKGGVLSYPLPVVAHVSSCECRVSSRTLGFLASVARARSTASRSSALLLSGKITFLTRARFRSIPRPRATSRARYRREFSYFFHNVVPFSRGSG